MKNNASVINGNRINFWSSMGGKEGIVRQNCQIMMKKFDEMGSNYAGRHTWPIGRHDLFEFSQLLFK